MMKMNILEWLYEYWVPVKGYEGLYEVSNWGKVRSLGFYSNNGRFNKPRIVKPVIGNSGYYQVTLCKNGAKKNFRINRIVANAFIPNSNLYEQVNHKSEEKTLNAVWNLEWCDSKYNCNYGKRNEKIGRSNSKNVLQFTKDNVLVCRFDSAIKAEKITGIKGISAVCRGNRNYAGGFKWRYTNETD